MKQYTFLVRETYEVPYTVEAENVEQAYEIMEDEYEEDCEYIMRNGSGGTEFRICCDECFSDFNTGDSHVHEIVDKNGNARLLCDRCLDKLMRNNQC